MKKMTRGKIRTNEKKYIGVRFRPIRKISYNEMNIKASGRTAKTGLKTGISAEKIKIRPTKRYIGLWQVPLVS